MIGIKKLNRMTLIALLVELLFIFSLVAGLTAYNGIFSDTVNGLNEQADRLNDLSNSVDIKEKIGGYISGFFAWTIIAVISFFALLIISRFFIYKFILGKERKFKKFLGFSLLWYLIWLIPLIFPFTLFAFISRLTMDSTIFQIIITILILIYLSHFYFSFIAYYLFFNKKKNPISSAFSTGIRILPRLILNLLIVFLILNVILIPSLFTSIHFFILLGLMAVFLTWARHYFSIVLREKLKSFQDK
ncbi:hypothetical protein K9M79_05545 [Candidatus Woesearchaeota archaeon]|nr:hypothetical protein [Candidatus Woesearchaeota archaeon]